MPPTDAGAHAAHARPADLSPGADPGAPASRSPGAGTSPGTDLSPGAGTSPRTDLSPGGPDGEDTLDLRLPDGFLAHLPDPATACGGSPDRGDDLLDRVADWGPTVTPAGVFHLVPVRVERDLPLISRWMNDPAVAAFWELTGPPGVTEDHLRAQLTGDGRSVPCVGVLDGTPMSYWEVYRADLDALARHCPTRPHDTGIHLLIGAAADRGRGLGATLIRAVADLVLDQRPTCARVLAEPDVRNTASVAAFRSAGFRCRAEVDLPAKRAALMVRDRHPRRPR